MRCTEAGVTVALRRRVERMRIPPERMESCLKIGIDYGFFGRDREDVLPILCVKSRNSSTGCLGATVVDRKGASDCASSFLTPFIKSLGFKRILMRSDNERSLLSLIERATCNLTGVELVLMTSPEGDHQSSGLAEVGVREINAQTRILRSQLEQRLGSRIDEKDPLMSWIPRHAANCVSRYRIMDDGRTPDQRRCGKTWKRPVVEFGESVHFRPVGENNAGDQRLLRGVYGTSREIWCHGLSHATWCEERNENCENDGTREMGSRVQCNVCLSSLAVETGSMGNLVRPVVPDAEADQGVAPVIVMPVVPKVDRRRYVTKRDLVKLWVHRRVSSMHAVGVRHAPMRRFLMMTDAEIALARSWQVMTIRDKLSE